MTSKQYLSQEDYDFALKNLHQFARHPDLKKATVATTKNAMGRTPYAFSGGFARVYKIVLNQKPLALRCWTRDPGKIKQRSQYINDFFVKNQLPYFVFFKYVEDAIFHKSLFSVSWMDWVEGDNLSEFLDKNIRNKQKILALANSFLEMVKDLHQHKIAHGDLQSENMKISENNGEIAIGLIDYDSLYFPSMPDNLLDPLPGVPTFQHPQRPLIMKEKADYFSELVIYLSLLVYAEEPSYWQKSQDKRLLFEEADFKNPDSSQIFAELQKLSPDVGNLSRLLMAYCKQPADSLQPLEQIITVRAQTYSPPPRTSTSTPAHSPTQDPFSFFSSKPISSQPTSNIPSPPKCPICGTQQSKYKEIYCERCNNLNSFFGAGRLCPHCHTAIPDRKEIGYCPHCGKKVRS